MQDILYLNSEHLDGLGLGAVETIDILERAFRQKAAGEVLMPPKIFFHHGGDRFYSAMTACSPPLGFAGCKWQSGDPANPARGLPYIQGLLILTESQSGQMAAVIDAAWITGKRTAAASALVARYQARAGAEELAILGCGVQGRAHFEALGAELPGLRRCRAFDTNPAAQEEYVRELDGRHGIRVRGAGDAREALRHADIVITGGPIRHDRDPVIVPGWIRPGALVIAIDYDSYVTDECIAAMDIVITDDRAQVEDAQAREGKFLGVRRIDAELAEVIARGAGARRDDTQRILAFNLGIALEDVATAAEVLHRARKMGTGVRLPV